MREKKGVEILLDVARDVKLTETVASDLNFKLQVMRAKAAGFG